MDWGQGGYHNAQPSHLGMAIPLDILMLQRKNPICALLGCSGSMQMAGGAERSKLESHCGHSVSKFRTWESAVVRLELEPRRLQKPIQWAAPYKERRESSSSDSGLPVPSPELTATLPTRTRHAKNWHLLPAGF